ncbi:ABC transporter substrate-binding protein [Undibacterium flavidum]|uniref:ABC transporter substrate-binding protein n=1 Tax=Undibacterium flavidum TaxID=2762297 RepID=A0ABR6YD09_9BURK|nr:helical backbone metal receptor [Undibacterium flavidum]MBC3874447.1 ABC transporter substrate-binding protein [Undibacterium flavidum]
MNVFLNCRVLNYRVLVCVLWASFFSANFFANAAQTIEIIDDRNVSVQFKQAPLRIVSVLPSLTESVCALGHCQRLVGVDRYSNFPTSLASLPRVGGSLDPSIEAIAALKPDVVLMSVASRAAERLQALGIKVLAMEPKNQADVHRILLKLGQLLEVNEVDTIWQEMNKGIDAAAKSLPASVKKMRVYFEVSNAPFAAGESSFIGETLQRLGAGNIVPAALGPFPKLNPEFIVRANPDVIMISERGFSALAARPGWSAIRALRENRVCVFTAAESDVLVRPGPRMADAAWIMAKCLKSKA